jgi:CMP-N-acetylneuraminic acid synthetase
MYENKKIVAIITARGGSKRLKDKNILDFAGKPLIAWSIAAAKGSKCLDAVLVSTDSEAIAKVSKQYGAPVPFMRPAALAQDASTSLDVIRHAIGWIKGHQRKEYDFILLLQPTSPLRTARHIDQGIEYYFDQLRSDRDTLVSVTEAGADGQWLMRTTDDGYIEFLPEGDEITPQGGHEHYQPNGAIFFGPTAEVLERGFYNGRTLPFMMASSDSIDIDKAEDLEKALKLFKQRSVLEEV